MDVDEIELIPGALDDRPFTDLGPVSVKVVKRSAHVPEVTTEQVNGRLREEVANRGGNAVVNLKYKRLGMSLTYNGALEATGTVVRFERREASKSERLLLELRSLTDAGLLTEAEYATKKAEVLARM
jgi:hypothetical protein